MNNEILVLAGKLMLAISTGNDNELKQILATLTTELNKEKMGDISPTLNKDEIGYLKFTEKEILKMPKTFRKSFRTQNKTVYYRKRKRGVRSCSYEARYRRNGYKISVSATNLETLKERFIEKINSVSDEYENFQFSIPKRFQEFSIYWFENFHKRRVKQNTYEHNLQLFNRHIKDRLGKYNIAAINPPLLQRYLDEFADRGKTADDLYSLLNQIFSCAVNHGIIKLNPLGMVFHETHEREHGKAISKADEQKLLNAYAGQIYQLYYAVILYTGLRPNEYPTATVDGDFIKAVNSKRHGKNGKIAYKRIPISPMLRPYLVRINQIELPQRHILEERFKKILPTHKLYDMRTTFQTRCSECGIPDNVIGVFMGNSIGKLKEAYTDFSDDYLIENGNKLNY